MTRTTEKYPAVAFSDSHLENTTELYGDKLVALDGDIGQIRDFYFEDKHWVIRYAVADTGSWLTGRLVLLSPHAFGKLDQGEKTMHINLRKMQIQIVPRSSPTSRFRDSTRPTITATTAGQLIGMAGRYGDSVDTR